MHFQEKFYHPQRQRIKAERETNFLPETTNQQQRIKSKNPHLLRHHHITFLGFTTTFQKMCKILKSENKQGCSFDTKVGSRVEM